MRCRILLPQIVELAVIVAATANGTVAGASTVEIRRDQMGVPHVSGASDTDIMYGAGYALAQDRLAQMELSRWERAGRLAEITGEDAVEADVQTRMFGFTEAELMGMFNALSPDHQAMMRAFVAGVNRRVAEVNADPGRLMPYEIKQLGIELRPWTLLDYIRVQTDFTAGRGHEITNLNFYEYLVGRYGAAKARTIFDDVLPLKDGDAAAVFPAEENRGTLTTLWPAAKGRSSAIPRQFSALEAVTIKEERIRHASRCLVVGPQRSATGNVLMMQSTSDGPEIHFDGGGFDTAGLTGFGSYVIGVPAMGRAHDHGWLLTNAEIDNADTFVEKLNPANKYQYWFQNRWHNMQRRVETIRVKGGNATKLEIAYTVHGVVTDWDLKNGRAFSRKIAGDASRRLSTWAAMIDMGRARDMKQFETAVSTLTSTFGVCYGDEKGQIAFWSAGLYPLRAPGVDPRLPTPGTGEFEWTGYAKLQQMPHVVNPKSGVIYSWNSLPMRTWTAGENARYGKTDRQQVDLDLLAQKGGRVTQADMLALNREIASTFASTRTGATKPAYFIPYLRAAAQGDARLTELVELMAGWNGLFTDADGDGRYDDPGLVAFEAWLPIAQQALVGSVIGDWWHRIDDYKHIKYRTSLLMRVIEGKDAATPAKFDFLQGRDRDAVLRSTLTTTLAKLRADFGQGPLRGLRQPVYYRYFDPSKKESSRPTAPVDSFFDRGDVELPAAMRGLAPAFVRDNGGDEWVAFMELAKDRREMLSVVDAGGQNLFIDPQGRGNPHLTDQIQRHVDLDLKVIPLDQDSVRAATEATQTLDVPSLPAEAVSRPRSPTPTEGR